MKYFIVVFLPFILFAACKTNKVTPRDPDTYYTCSMDPQVIEYKPGKCPICHMELTPVKKIRTENKDEILLNEKQIELGNIHLDTIRSGTIGDHMVLTATLNLDQTKAYSVSSRVMGRNTTMKYFIAILLF